MTVAYVPTVIVDNLTVYASYTNVRESSSVAEFFCDNNTLRPRKLTLLPNHFGDVQTMLNYRSVLHRTLWLEMR